MKIKKFLEALELVKPALANREIVEQSTSFAFIKGMVTTFNDEISISHPIDINFSGAIKAEPLYKLLSKFGSKEIELIKKDKQIRIKAKRINAGIAFEDKIRLPLKELEARDKLKWVKLTEDFGDALTFAIPSCARNNSRPILTCIHLSDKSVEASDSYRITNYNVTLPFRDALLPVSTAIVLRRYKLVEVAKEKTWLHFRTDKGTLIACRLFEGKYPDISQLIEVKGKKLTFPKKLSEILDRAITFSNQAIGQAAGGEELITITLNDSDMIVQSKNDFGWFKEKTGLKEAQTDEVSFGINPLLLKEIISQNHTCVINTCCLKFEGKNWVHVIALKG